MLCPAKKSTKGFTLVELMIVVAIIGILASVAAPAYINHINRTRESSGVQNLLDMKLAQEKYFSLFDVYAVGGTFTSNAFRNFLNFNVANTQYYLYTSIGGATSTSFTIRGCFDLNQNAAYTSCFDIDDTAADPARFGVADEGFNWSILTSIF